MSGSAKAGRAWIARNMVLGRRAVRPVVWAGVAGTVAAIGQAWCLGQLLVTALGAGGPVDAVWPLAFVVLTLLRAALMVASDTWSFGAGAAARRRLRSDLFVRLFGAGPRA
ncbi:MAG: thiol reductant ABC exporter subunit CydD, partial [Gemmatimonadaceae bacterium]|nr:thiol reductant ABC exporter subunit CydD [Acetobacteraceae bacterium]